MTRRIALATWSGLPNLSVDDQLLGVELGRRGLTVVPQVWDDPGVDWKLFDAVLLRSTWDYHRRLDEFLGWASRCAGSTVLWNSLETVRWNSHKSYLGELARRGVPVVPTEPGRRGETLAELCDRKGWSTVVVKPAVSAAAEKSYYVPRGEREAFEPRYRAALNEGEQMVQPFQEGVLSPGEHSLVYFDGRYSHAFPKGPALPVDRRVDVGFRAVTPSAPERRIADAVLRLVTPVPLYARIDLVEGAGSEPLLMELELIEPALGFEVNGKSAGRLADALQDRLEGVARNRAGGYATMRVSKPDPPSSGRPGG